MGFKARNHNILNKVYGTFFEYSREPDIFILLFFSLLIYKYFVWGLMLK